MTFYCELPLWIFFKMQPYASNILKGENSIMFAIFFGKKYDNETYDHYDQ